MRDTYIDAAIAIGEGRASLTWDMLVAPAASANSLTGAGRDTTAWAFETFRDFFGPGWPALMGAHDLAFLNWHYNPTFDAPHVFCRLWDLATRLALVADLDGFGMVKKAARRDPNGWLPLLMQLEVAGLAIRNGWSCELEPRVVPNRKKRADVRAARGDVEFLVEAKNLELAQTSRTIFSHDGALSEALQQIAWQRHVDITADVTGIGAQDAVSTWLVEVDRIAASVQGSGLLIREKVPGGGAITVARGTGPGLLQYSGMTARSEERHRVVRAIAEKAEQSQGPRPVWLRVDQTPLFWYATSLPPESPRDAFHAAVASLLAEAVQPFEHVAGVIFSRYPDVGQPEVASTVLDIGGRPAMALTTPLWSPFYREVVIVEGSHPNAAEQFDVLTSWYRNEASFLDWALGATGQPPLARLLRDSGAESGRLL